MDSEAIAKIIRDFEKDVKSLRQEALQFAWYMRGGLSYEDALMLSIEERKLIGKLIESNIETTKKSGMPFF